jgi:hypothetical protein
LARLGWLCIPSVACLLLSGCNKNQHKKPDPTKGAVTGIVLCADTGKPARFATVTLSAIPKAGEKGEQGDPLPATEVTVTDLDGRFRLEAVEPGRYYAFATLEGYLDPVLGLDLARLNSLASDRERTLDAISQWKDHLTEVMVNVHRVADLSLQVERGAEIDGAVTFDDGSPAIGMHFQLLRTTQTGGWSDVGMALFDGWSIHAVSDSHGRFSLTNLPAGEYTVCALMPSESQEAAARVCLGNTFRKRDAKTVKVQAAEIFKTADIEIPLSGLHTVAGTVSAIADGHALGRGTVRLLYADDRERARETSLLEDGSFSLEYVPESKYVLQVSGAQDAEAKGPESAPGGSEATPSTANTPLRYADKEIPVTVLGDMEDIQVQLTSVRPDKPQNQ